MYDKNSNRVDISKEQINSFDEYLKKDTMDVYCLTGIILDYNRDELPKGFYNKYMNGELISFMVEEGDKVIYVVKPEEWGNYLFDKYEESDYLIY